MSKINSTIYGSYLKAEGEYSDNYNPASNSGQVIMSPIQPTVYPADVMNKLQEIKNFSYGTSLLTKSKYATRGAIVGIVLGFATFTLLKKSKFVGTLVGGISGVVIGKCTGDYLAKRNLLKSQQIKNEQQQ
jgi:hypothetical protein